MKKYFVNVTFQYTTWKNESGQLHREEGPAIEWENGVKEWYINGELHREDGPAVESDTEKKWLINGELHREDGPAIEYASGRKCWFVNGKRHRLDGPAIEDSNGTSSWYLDGMYMTEYEFKEKTNSVKELTVTEIEKLLGHKVKVVK